MINKVRQAVLFAAAAASAWGQTRPGFEVASVKRIVDYVPTATMNGDIEHGRLTLNNAHLSQLIAVAYEIQGVRIFGVPGALSSEQFQIVAKAEDPATTEPQVRAMLQTLLADRFKLKFHWEDKQLSNFTLRTAASGSKLERAQEDGVDRCSRQFDGTSYDLACDHVRIATLANALALQLRSPVVDQTGLTGSYNFTLHWQGDDLYAAVPDALEKYGLKMEMKKVATQVLVIDSVERPTEN